MFTEDNCNKSGKKAGIESIFIKEKPVMNCLLNSCIFILNPLLSKIVF